MADALFLGFSVPSQPNSGIAVLDSDATPEQTAVRAALVGYGAAGELVEVVSVVVNDNDVQVTFSVPPTLNPGTVTGSGGKFRVTSATVSNFTLTQNISRFLRRLSKLNRGAN
jgi:hypothetical protein